MSRRTGSTLPRANTSRAAGAASGTVGRGLSLWTSTARARCGRCGSCPWRAVNVEGLVHEEGWLAAADVVGRDAVRRGPRAGRGERAVLVAWRDGSELQPRPVGDDGDGGGRHLRVPGKRLSPADGEGVPGGAGLSRRLRRRLGRQGRGCLHPLRPGPSGEARASLRPPPRRRWREVALPGGRMRSLRRWPTSGTRWGELLTHFPQRAPEKTDHTDSHWAPAKCLRCGSPRFCRRITPAWKIVTL